MCGITVILKVVHPAISRKPHVYLYKHQVARFSVQSSVNVLHMHMLRVGPDMFCVYGGIVAFIIVRSCFTCNAWPPSPKKCNCDVLHVPTNVPPKRPEAMQVAGCTNMLWICKLAAVTLDRLKKLIITLNALSETVVFNALFPKRHTEKWYLLLEASNWDLMELCKLL